MRAFSELRGDCRGASRAVLLLIAMLAAIPFLYPAKTAALIKGVQSNWEGLWTIDGLSGRA